MPTNCEYKYFYFTNVSATWLVICNNYFCGCKKTYNFKQNYLNSTIVFVKMFALENVLYCVFFTNFDSRKNIYISLTVIYNIFFITLYYIIICFVLSCYFTFSLLWFRHDSFFFVIHRTITDVQWKNKQCSSSDQTNYN